MELNKKVAIVTGANRGIGKVIAIGLAKLDYQVVLIGRDHEELRKVAKEINKRKNKPIIDMFDITDYEQVIGSVNHIAEFCGRIDVLVNNAGIYREGTSTISIKDVEQQLTTNLVAPFAFMKAVTPIMKEQGSGYIFNIASRAGKVGFSDSGGYSASKFGLVGLSESFYRELSEFGISVTSICPGWVDTKMAVEAGTPYDGFDMIQPSDIMKTIEYLLELSPAARIKEVVIETKKGIV